MGSPIMGFGEEAFSCPVYGEGIHNCPHLHFLFPDYSFLIYLVFPAMIHYYHLKYAIFASLNLP